MRRKASPAEIESLRSIAAFQWSWRVAEALFPRGEEFVLDVVRGKIRYVIQGGKVYLTLRPNDGFFSLSLNAARRLIASVPPPKFRIIVKGDREIRGSILARDVVRIDSELRPGDEVVIVDPTDKIIGVGRLKVPVPMIEGLEYGEVARVRSRA